MIFQPGQTVTARHAMYGEVVGQVLSVRPSSRFTGRDIVEVDVQALKTQLNVLDDQCTLIPTPEASMTAADASTPARKSSNKAPATAPSTPVDFKEMAAQTRAKMQAGSRKARALAIEPDMPFPVTETQLDAATVPATQEHAIALPELPGTPVLISPVDVPLGTLGLHAVPLHQTARSGCNVRHHYAQDAIEELADSLKAEGQIENATGRWNAQGEVEIVAGESRRRAQLLRQERGETGLTLLVNIRDLSDGDALAISATENMRRRSMTPLEECEAMQRLQEAGRSVEEITAMFGFKSQQPVADRILVAKNLHTTPRELLDQGGISLAQAFVIARAPGVDLQLGMTTNANRYGHSAKTLSEALTRGQFLVKAAKFNVAKSGLEIRRDLFDAFEPYFEDKGKALDAQLAWAKAHAEKLAQKRAFAHVISGENSYFSRWDSKYSKVYDQAYEKDGDAGTVVYVCTATGEITEERSLKLRPTVSVAADGAAQAAPATRKMPESAYLEAHERRAAAVRESVVGNTHLTLALTVWGLLAADSVGMVKMGEIKGLPKDLEGMPGLKQAVAALRERIKPTLEAKSTSYGQHPLLSGTASADRQALLALLISCTDEELLGHLNTLTCITSYDWAAYGARTPARPEYPYLASLTDAPQRLAQAFTLTDEWLKRYPRHELIALAEEAGLGRALVEDCSTLKEMRARILEHAARLHTEGFVPKLVRFPDPPTLAAEQTAAD